MPRGDAGFGVLRCDTFGVHHEREPGDHVAPRPSWERTTVVILLVATSLLRVFYVFHYRIDSDEPQHLHVVWGWAHGLLQYRDVFDNHAPLFHMMCAPLVALIGERSDIVFLMRLAMLPLYAVVLWSVYALGRALYCRSVGLWSAALTALFPSVFLTALEFRTDDLWVLLWLLALVVLSSERPTVRRAALAGLLLGMAMSVSLKTVLLVLALAAATPGAVVLTHGRWRPLPGGVLARCALAFILGLAIVPAILVGVFATRGALGPLLYGAVIHNTLPGLGEWHAHPLRPVFLVPILPAVWYGARALVHRAPTAALGFRRALLFLASGLVFALLVGVWPIVSPEDFLPVAAVGPLFLVATVLTRPPPPVTRPARHALAPRTALLLLVGAEALVVLGVGTPWDGRARAETAFLADVLRLTRPHEYVMDLKGETIFRPRPFFYVIEAVTKTRLRQALIADSIPERLIATRTRVVVPDQKGFPPRARAFMNANYLSVGSLRVLGRLLGPPSRTGPTSIPFEVVIPARYAIVTDGAACAGSLDGAPYDGPRDLRPGLHEFHAAAGEGQLALIWASALQRGFSPFAAARPCG